MAVRVQDGSGNPITSTAGAVDVNIKSSSGTTAISAASLPLPAGAAADGADGASPPSIPGTGIRGWLRSIYDRLAGVLSVSVSNFPATQPVSAASLPLPAGAATSANQATEIGSLSTIAANIPTPVAKGTQGASAQPVQDLKDSGRVIKVFSASFSATTTEALLSLTPITDGTPGTAATSFTVTSGKRLRLQAMAISVSAPSTTAVGAAAHLRMTATGAVTVSSPLVGTVGCGLIGTQVAQQAAGDSIDFPDGLELSGTMQFGITQQGIASAGFHVTLIGYEY